MKDARGGRLSRLIPPFLRGAARGRWLRSQTTFLSFLLPAAILLIVLVIYPVVATLTLSVVDSDGRFVGLQNYQKVIGSRETLNPACLQNGPPCGSLINNLIWIAIHLPLTLFTGLFIAVLLQNVRGGSLVKSLISLLEPIMIVFLGFAIGAIVISLFLPLIKLLEGLSK